MDSLLEVGENEDNLELVAYHIFELLRQLRDKKKYFNG